MTAVMMPERLFGLDGDELLRDTLDAVIESWWDDGNHGEVVVHEWSVHPARHHLPAPDVVLDLIHDRACDLGEVDEWWCEHAQSAIADPAVVAAAEALLGAIAERIGYGMADSIVARHTVRVEDSGDQLLYAVMASAYYAREVTP